ncbi:hypothetical protein [Salinilacihabitans rarus]|uniref:hypothetical protein n=1 Tax=Salinilacihabitans rarus TaxID=2961596 RepID=UPI0020C92908|nr:hypothetical protein [Salinilacihabitans rarus]
MSDADSYGSDEPFADSLLTPEHIAAVAGAFDVPVFAYVAYLLFEEPAFGALVGLLVGGGTYLFLPYFMYAEAADDAAERTRTSTRPDRGFHRTAAGLALAPAGILLLAWRFASDDVLVGVAAVVVIAAVVYAALSRVVPRA